jgi:hypothetical protein
MGDRCYMTIVIHKDHAERFLEAAEVPLYRPDWEDQDGDFMVFGFDGVNYALGIGGGSFGELPKGFPLYGWHTAGGCYGEGVFATDGVKIAACDSVHGCPAICVPDPESDDPNCNVDDLAEIHLYYDLMRSVTKET